MKRILLLAIALLFLSVSAEAQIQRLAEMNTEQISKLNKEKTVVLLTGGIMEEHGPFLPSFTDGFWNERLTNDLAKAMSAKPGWSVVLFPTIPLGNSGANDIGGKFNFPGTYAVRFTTLRAIFMDLATELGEQGFRWVFIIHGHGAPNHNRALDQAGDYFRDVYGGHMVNLAGLMPVFSAWDGKKSEKARKEDGLVIHAGMDETSMMLALRPDLVSPEYKRARPFASGKMEDLISIAQKKDWLGYFGSPRLASPKQYANGWQIAAKEATNIALKILDGFDERQMVRFADELLKSPPDVQLDESSLKHEEEVRQKQADWLKKKGLQ